MDVSAALRSQQIEIAGPFFRFLLNVAHIRFQSSQAKQKFQLFKFASQISSRLAKSLTEGLNYDCSFAAFQKNTLSAITKFIVFASAHSSDHTEHAPLTKTVFECFKNKGLFDAVINCPSNSDAEISRLANEFVLKCGILKIVCGNVGADDRVVCAAACSRLRRTLQVCLGEAVAAIVTDGDTPGHVVRLLMSTIPSVAKDCAACIGAICSGHGLVGAFARLREDWSRSHHPHAELILCSVQSHFTCTVLALHFPYITRSYLSHELCIKSNTNGDSSVSPASISAAGDGGIDSAADNNAADTARLRSR
jgi:hypothetical protein